MIIIVVEELEIIVTAKVEEAIKQFKKIVPEIKKAVQQTQESFEKMDTKGMTNKVKQAVQLVKKKIEDLKKSNQNNEIKLTVNNKEAQKQISQIQKEIDSLQQKINARQMKLNITNNTLDKMRAETNQTVIKEMPEAGNRTIKNETYKRLEGNEQYNSLVKESDKLNNEVIKYNSLLETAKQEMSSLGSETLKTAANQGKTTTSFNDLKGKLTEAKEGIDALRSIFNKIPNIAKFITNHIKGMGKGVKTGLKQVIKYAGALFSIRSIYSTLSSSASSWLSSQNAGAKQLSTNIEYMKNSLGSALAPTIQWITNLLYNMMKAVQSVVYALFRVNIFANASSKSYSAMAGSAKKAKKETQSLSGIYDELNNITNNDTENDSSGSGSITPSFDLSQLDGQMSPLAQKLYDFFKPLKESWDNYGTKLIEQVKVTAGQVGGLIASIWESFENIITNGTIYKTLELILAIIGNIAEAFANAWNYNGNGNAIIQNLANALNNLLGAINNVAKSEEFQNWLNNCSDKFREISEKIAEINWQPLINALSDIGQNLGNIALDILSGLVDIFKWLVENPIVAEIIASIAVALSIVSAVLGIISVVLTILNPILSATTITLLPLIGIILGIIAVIALVVLAIMNWDTIMEWLRQTIETVINAVVEFFTNLWNKVSFIFEAIWNIVSPIINAIWQIISTIFQAIWNILSNILGSIWNIFSQIFNWIWQLISKVFQGIWNIISPIINKVWDVIKFVLGKIQEIWSTVWNTISTVVNKVWNGIWNGIKTVINFILSGIENFVNGTIKGINKLLSGISSVANAIGSLIGLDPINLQINTISLPRLAKGGVLTQPTTVLAGEYAGARSNPEIVTPQNIMYETTRRAIEDAGFHNSNNGQTINLTVKVGNKKLGQVLLDDLRDMTRQTGKDIEALVGG